MNMTYDSPVHSSLQTSNNNHVFKIVVFSLAYFGAHQIAYFFPDSKEILAAVWPAGGIGLAALLLSPRRLWPVIITSLFLAGNLANLLTTDRPVFNSLGFMTANMLESLGSAWFITKTCGNEVRFTRIKEIMSLLVSATAINALTGLVGAGTATIAHVSGFWSFWLTWWVADGLGILLVSPLILAWVSWKELLKDAEISWAVESVIFVSLWVTASWCIFNMQSLHFSYGPEPYILFALISWASLRLRTPVLTLSLVILAVVVITGSSVSTGPLLLGGNNPTERLLLIQLFIGVIAATGFLLSASHSEAKIAEKAAREEHDRLRAIGDNLPDGMVYQVLRHHDDSRQFLYVSAGVEKINGVTAEEVLRDASILYGPIPEQGQTRIAALEAESAEKLTTFKVVTPYLRPDGEMRWLDISSTPRRLSDGRIVWDGIQTDITVRKQIEDRLKESEERLALALTATRDAIWDWDLSGNSLYYSPRWWAMIGYQENELKADPDLWRRLMHPEDLERAGRIIEEAIAGKTGFEVESRLLHKDGHYVPIVTKGIVLRNDRGHAVRALGTNADLTGQKKLEQERILFEQRRQQVQKAESLKRMAGSMAHNFNNMLGVVIGNLELVMDDLPQDEVISTNISEAFQAANRAADLTRLMLTYLGQAKIKHGRMDLSNTCDDHIRTLRKDLKEGTVLNIDFQRPGPVISGNASQIRQILKNLVTNASESLDPGGGTIHLSTKTVLSSNIPPKRFPVDFHPQDTSYACLEVEDTGCGIPDKSIEHLFDPFYTTKFTGRGLGLPVVLGLVQEYDGVITVEITPSKGSIFGVFFPLSG